MCRVCYQMHMRGEWQDCDKPYWKQMSFPLEGLGEQIAQYLVQLRREDGEEKVSCPSPSCPSEQQSVRPDDIHLRSEELCGAVCHCAAGLGCGAEGLTVLRAAKMVNKV